MVECHLIWAHPSFIKAEMTTAMAADPPTITTMASSTISNRDDSWAWIITIEEITTEIRSRISFWQCPSLPQKTLAHLMESITMNLNHSSIRTCQLLIWRSWSKKCACIGWKRRAERETTASICTCIARTKFQSVSSSKKMVTATSRTPNVYTDILKNLSPVRPRSKSSVRITSAVFAKWVGLTANFGMVTRPTTKRRALTSFWASAPMGQIVSLHTWGASSPRKICH